MKNKSLIFLLLALFLVIGAAAWLYPRLEAQYTPETVPVSTAVPSEAPAEESADPAVSPTPQPKLPDFTIFDAEGEPMSFYEFEGKPLVINFWATWCGPCKIELPAFEDAYSRYGDSVGFLMVNMDGTDNTVESVRSFLAETGYTFPVWYDTEFSAAFTFGVSSIPLTLFVRDDLTLWGYRMGAMEAEELETYINALLQE